MSDEVVVWLSAYSQYAILIQRNAYYSVVRWNEDGQTYEVEIDNDDYDIVGDDDDTD